ncbi:MAG: hypothetical protein AAF250_10835 [Pseudomonadota bacterium]
MAFFLKWSDARMMGKGEQSLHWFRNSPNGVQSANVFGDSLITELAADLNISDQEYDEILDEIKQWTRKAFTGDFHPRTGRRVHTFPRPDRMRRFEYFLFKHRLMQGSDWLGHLVSMNAALEFAQDHGLMPFADAAIMGGRLFYDFLHENIGEDRAEFTVLQFAHLEPKQRRPEPYIRVRRFMLVIDRNPLERTGEFARRVERYDSDYGYMTDEVATIGTDCGAIFDPALEDTQTRISDFEWQFANRQNRIVGFTETSSSGPDRLFKFARRRPEISKMRAIQQRIDEINYDCLEAAE